MKTCCIRLCLLLGWLLPLMAGCSKEEVWTPFGVGEYGSYSMLPDHEVYELEIKGGTPPYRVETPEPEVVDVTLHQNAGGGWMLRLETRGEEGRSCLVTLTDASGRATSVQVMVDCVRLCYVCQAEKLFLSSRVSGLGLEREIEELMNSCPYPFVGKSLCLDFSSPCGGWLSEDAFRNVPFTLDAERENIRFDFLGGDSRSFALVGEVWPEDEPNHYALLPKFALPPVTWLVEDFTEEFSRQYPGVLMEGDFVKRGYCLEVLW